MQYYKIPVLEGPTLNSGTRTVSGVIPTGALLKFAAVPVHDPESGEGYQRNPSSARVNKLAARLRSGAIDLPTGVLLSIRDTSFDDIIFQEQHGQYTMMLSSHLAETTHQLHIVDGQHRFRALEKAAEDNQHIREQKIPFICLIGAQVIEEMMLFYTVNTNAKPVPRDLVLELLDKMDAEGALSELWKQNHEDKQYQKLLTEIMAARVAKHLNLYSSSWKNKIKLANASNSNNTIGLSAFVRSLRGIIGRSELFSEKHTISEIAQILDAYWGAIRSIYPKAFQTPSAYNLQAGVGAITMHSIFPHVLGLVRLAGNRGWQCQEYVEHLEEPLLALEDTNRSELEVRGVEFWRSGETGAAQKYSSEAGYNVLQNKVLTLFPSVF